MDKPARSLLDDARGGNTYVRPPVDECDPEVGVKAATAFSAMTQEELTGPPIPTGEAWQQHFNRIQAERVARGRELLDAFLAEQREARLRSHRKLGGILDQTLVRIEERLEQGDPVMSPTGQVVYRPVRLRDLDSLAGTVIDRQLALERRIAGEEGHGEAPSTNVQRLLVRLELVAQQNPVAGEVRGEYREPRVIDAESE